MKMCFRTFTFSVVCAVAALLTGCAERSSATAKLPNDIATVGIQVKASQRKMKVNEKVVLPISIHNNGVATIPSEGKPDGTFIVLATYHWLRADGSVAVWDGARTQLPSDIAKGKSVDIPLSLKAPAEPGKYILVIDLVQEGALWFADTGSQTATLAYVIEN